MPFATIIDTINEFLEPLVSQVMDFFSDFDVWLQAIILLFIAIFMLVGLFVFMKKFIKLFIVLAVLAAIFWFVYTRGYLDNFLMINIFNFIHI